MTLSFDEDHPTGPPTGVDVAAAAVSVRDGVPDQPLDAAEESAWFQEERQRMEVYTEQQLTRIRQQREALLAQQAEVERNFVVRQQELNRRMQLLGPQLTALQDREEALAAREHALVAQWDELRVAQQALVKLYQAREEALAQREDALAGRWEDFRSALAQVAVLEAALAECRHGVEHLGFRSAPDGVAAEQCRAVLQHAEAALRRDVADATGQDPG
jgi:DNA repair exonuclease SbcCD ATPase subunit